MKWLARNVWAFLWLLIARALAVDGPAFERVERVFRARCYECRGEDKRGIGFGFQDWVGKGGGRVVLLWCEGGRKLAF